MELLRSAWLLPIASPPIRDGLVAVSGGRVLWVGRRGDPGKPDAPLRDLGDGVLLPGLVNAHTHLELSHLAGMLPATPGGFVPWVEAVVASRGRHTEAEIAAAAAAAVAVLEASGTVAVGDVSNTLAHLGRLAASSLSAVVFLELLAWDPAKAEATLAWVAEIKSLPGVQDVQFNRDWVDKMKSLSRLVIDQELALLRGTLGDKGAGD